MFATKTLKMLQIAALVSAMSGAAAAQSNGSIAGTVKDPNGAVVPGANVTVVNRDQGLTQTTRASEEGTFVFAQLPPGVYSLVVEVVGFKKKENNGVVLPVSSRVSVGDLVLEIGNLTETVTVEADAGTIQLQSESGERSNIVNQQAASRYPVERP